MAVTFEQAMNSKPAAIDYLRSTKNVEPDKKGQLVAKYGKEFVEEAMSVDSTKYEIEDEDKQIAHDKGYNSAKDSADGYERDKAGNWMRAGLATAASVGSTVLSLIAITFGAANDANRAKNRALMWIAASLNASVVAQYYAAKPNKAATEAADELQKNALPEAQATLFDAQDQMETAAEEVLELTEEAEEKNEDANKKNEEDKTMFDYYRQQNEAVAAQKASGQEITPDKQALVESNNQKMSTLSEGINKNTENTSNEVGELNDEIGEYQEVYDQSAENMAEIQGVTDYAESFDTDTRDNARLMQVAMYANTAASAALSVRLIALTGTIFTKVGDYIFAGIAALAGLMSGKAAAEQGQFANLVDNEIETREAVQDLNSETNDIYEDELDGYASNIDFINDLTIEVPEDLEVPTESAPAASQSMMSMAAEQSQKKDDSAQTPAANTKTQGPNKSPAQVNEPKEDDDKKKKTEDKK